jgi:hypothetical protein
MGIFDNLKSIGKVLQEAGKIEQYKQILESVQELLEMQKKIEELENENKNLKEKLEIKEKLEYDSENNVYWVIKDGKKEGPYCSLCWDDYKKLIHLHNTSQERLWICPKCKTYAGFGRYYSQNLEGGRDMFTEDYNY